MFTKNIKFKSFTKNKKNKFNKFLRNILKEKSLIEKYPLLQSLNKNYKYSYQKKKLNFLIDFQNLI